MWCTSNIVIFFISRTRPYYRCVHIWNQLEMQYIDSSILLGNTVKRLELSGMKQFIEELIKDRQQ